MKIGIVATHSFPIPYPNLHTGDVVILDLANSLKDMGHQVTLYAPAGTNFSNLCPMKASFGKYPPSSEECEIECFNSHKSSLFNQDIIHDFSVTKRITQCLNGAGYLNTCCTLMGGAWTQNIPPHNLIVWSKAHRNRVLRGATDYEGTPTPDLAGPPGMPVKDAHIVYGGVNTDFYLPTYNKKDYFLWMGRWHNVRGYRLAIDIAQRTGINLILAGEHPDNELFSSQKTSAMEAARLASGLKNIKIEWLPPDPDHHAAKIKLYQEATAFLYTVQFHEPFGLSQVESLACGTPVIATNYGSMPEVISDGETGYVVNNDVHEFINATKKISDISPSICRKQVVNRFDRHVMAASYLTEYQTILNGRGWA